MTGLPMQYVRDTIVSEDVHGLFELKKKKKKDWLYFIGKLFKLSEKDYFDLENLGTDSDIGENDLLLDIITNLQACKSFHNNL